MVFRSSPSSKSCKISVAEIHEPEFSQPEKSNRESRWQDSNSSKHGHCPLAVCTPPPYLHPLYFPLQPKVGRRGGIWKGIRADRFWKPRQLEKTLGGSILLIYAAFHSLKCFNFTLISKITVKISNAAWSFSCLHRAGSVFKGGPLTADLLPRVGARVGCAVARHTSATQQ